MLKKKTFLINYKTPDGLLDFVEIKATSESFALIRFYAYYPNCEVTSIEEI